jgi:addiction module HigA family antidote
MNIVHPGKRLAALLKAHKITSYRCAQAIGMQPPHIYEIVKGKRPVTPLLAMRLGRYFGDGAEAWLEAQMRYDLAAIQKTAAATVAVIVPIGTERGGSSTKVKKESVK